MTKGETFVSFVFFVFKPGSAQASSPPTRRKQLFLRPLGSKGGAWQEWQFAPTSSVRPLPQDDTNESPAQGTGANQGCAARLIP